MMIKKDKNKEKSTSKKSSVKNDMKMKDVVPPNHGPAPYTLKIINGRGVIVVIVQLHKIPPQYINWDTTNEFCFHLDTLKYTKKYYNNFRYPHGIKVQVNPEPEATFNEYGQMTAELKIADWGLLTQQHEEFEAMIAQKSKEKKKLVDGQKKEKKRKIVSIDSDKNNHSTNEAKKQKTDKRDVVKHDVVEKVNKKKDHVGDIKQSNVSTSSSFQIIYKNPNRFESAPVQSESKHVNSVKKKSKKAKYPDKSQSINILMDIAEKTEVVIKKKLEESDHRIAKKEKIETEKNMRKQQRIEQKKAAKDKIEKVLMESKLKLKEGKFDKRRDAQIDEDERNDAMHANNQKMKILKSSGGKKVKR